MQIFYRVKLHIAYHVGVFDFNNFEQACKFADAAKVSNVKWHDDKVRVTIDLLTKEEAEEDYDDD